MPPTLIPRRLAVQGVPPTVSVVSEEPQGQNIALLCCGPSLREVWDESKFDDYSMVVAVNTAGWIFRCHWLCAADHDIFTNKDRTGIYDPQGRLPLCGILSNAERGKEAKLRGLQWHPLKLQGPDWIARHARGLNRHPPDSVQCCFTFPNALAWSLVQARGGMVHVYGIDFSQTPGDVVGKKGCHDPKRWQKESAWLQLIWQPSRIRCFGRIKPNVLAYLEGRESLLKL